MDDHRTSRETGAQRSSFAMTSRPGLLIGGFLGFLVLVLVFATVRSADDLSAASLGTITTATNLKVEVNDTGITPTVIVREDFTGIGSSDLNGRLTDYNGGGSYAPSAGPAFQTVAAGSNATNVWHGAQRDLGPNFSAALVPWLTRKSALQVQLKGTINNTVDAGMIINTSAFATSGVAVRVNCTGSTSTLNCKAQLVNITGAASWSSCSSQVTVNTGKAPTRFDITDFINDAGATGNDITVTVDKTKGSGGTTPATLTCEPAAPATGSYSGLMSFAPSSSMSFDNMFLTFI